MRKVFLFLSVVAMLLTSLALSAQLQTITGTVVAAAGERLEGVMVSIAQPRQGRNITKSRAATDWMMHLL